MTNETIRKALKTKRCRVLKNILWVLLGLFVGIMATIGVAYYVLKAIPLKTFIGEQNEIASEKVTDKSVIDTIKSLGDYKVGDLPIVESSLKDVFSGDLSAYATVDYEKLNGYALSDIGTAIGESVKINTESIKLVDFFPYAGNEKVYSLICDATGEPTANDVTFDSFENFDTNKIKLTSVIDDVPANAEVFDVLRSATGKATNAELTVADFDQNFDNKKIQLSVVYSYDLNKDVFKLLCDAVGVADDDETAKALTMGQLNGFDSNKIKLHRVLPNDATNEKFYNILKDVTAKTDANTITLGDLKNFETTNIKLSSVLTLSEVSGNALLEALVADTTVTLGNIKDKANNLKLEEVYNITCFTQTATDTREETVKYRKTESAGVVTYTKVDAGETGDDIYYISKSSNTWFFMLYKTEGSLDLQGYASSYVQTGMNFGSIAGSEGLSSVTTRINTASIRQLWAIGVLNGTYSEMIMGQTLDQVLTAV